MKRRTFLSKGTAGVFALGVAGCSSDERVNPLSSSANASTVSGMIAGPEGYGIEGVAVTVAGSGFQKTVITGSGGNYSLGLPSKGEYTIVPRKSGYDFTPKTQKIVVSTSKKLVVNILAIITALSGSITTTELGTTGITVSKFGFGSHIYEENAGSEREKTIRTALDHGVTTFDIYNTDQGAHQYEPLGTYLAPVINDVVLSICYEEQKGVTLEDKLDNDLRLIGREYIDMYRLHSWSPDDADWHLYEDLFRLRDAGKIRAVGVPIHQMSDLEPVLEAYENELDYVFFPYNFYHNIGWPPELHPEFPTLAQTLREKGIGVVSIKPFAGDYFIGTLREAAASINPDLSFTQAALRYVLNSGLEPDTTFTGMNHFSEFVENIQAFHEPEMSDDEQVLLDGVKAVAEKTAHAVLPDHYRFLDSWAPASDEAVGLNLA